MGSPVISPAELYPPGGRRPAYRLIDVRAPVEVANGALPGAASLPLMNDEERHRVGIRYKEAGQQAAIDLGYELVGPDLPRRIEAWRAQCKGGPTAVLCWRGGLRSQLTCDFIDMPGVARVEGGYKAVRSYLSAQLELRVAAMRPVVIAGLTGSGKTTLLNGLGATRPDILALDLEEAANHRGSAFGPRRGEQPSQATFENRLALEVTLSGASQLLLEDESRHIGRREVPSPLAEAIRTSPVLLVDEPLESRVRQIHEDYVRDLGESMGSREAQAFLEASLLKLKKRLSHSDVQTCLLALAEAARSSCWAASPAHDRWIRILLERYYDPLYRKSLTKLGRPVLFSGRREECYQWMTQVPSVTP